MNANIHLSRHANQPLLGVKRKLWRKDDEHADVADSAFAAIRTEVLRRDHHTCVFCGFSAAKYQEVHHKDDDHTNNAYDNLITVCNVCHQVHHLGMCAMRNGGFIAAVPELTQTEINNIVRAIFVTDLIGDSDIKDKLKGLYAIFQSRGQDLLKGIFGIDISSPFTLAEVLSNCPDEMFTKRGELLAPLRLVPTREAFNAGQLEYYAANSRAIFLPENWSGMARQLVM
ncbi:type IV secretion protein DotN [Xanthomonas citri pv. fuscans]|uniref:type IVB secretion system protein IcmJDotN n=1 Tax=Xanthomonas TaxID=338 RepID=UPI00036FEA6A|nr:MULTISPECIES: type IVB secretion system protein IcmJDotN [Xanthomonas]KGT54018.1 type IV secretion protein DotN [Xanthomonas citri pv. fuscans]